MRVSRQATQQTIFEFFETRVAKSSLFKLRDKLKKKQTELNLLKQSDAKYEKAQKAVQELTDELKKLRQEVLHSELLDFVTAYAENSDGKPYYQMTHLVKFDNSSAEYGGIKDVSEKDTSYMTTSSLPDPTYDITYNNAIKITPAGFLNIKVGDSTIFERIQKQDFQWLYDLFGKSSKTKGIAENFSSLVAEQVLKNAQGLKQVYFPVDDGYHQIAPIFASSLCQSITDKIDSVRKGENYKRARAARRAGQYTDGFAIYYPGCAVLKFGGTQPQNVSVLNQKRYGQAILLSCAAPKWSSILSPPVNTESIFSTVLSRLTFEQTTQLRRYLIALKGKAGTMESRRHITLLVDSILDIVFNYAASIQALTEHAGWSQQSQLKATAQRLWLDPHNPDEEFKQQRKLKVWQQEICEQFAEWLNKQLRGKYKKLDYQLPQAKYWQKLCKRTFELLGENLVVEEVK